MRYFKTVVLLILPVLVSSYYVKIGILSNDPDTFKTKKIWSFAQNYSTMMSLEPVVKVTQWWSNLDAADIARTVCSLVKEGVNGLVYLGPPRWNSLVASYSSALSLPFVSSLDNSDTYGKYQVSLLPDTTDTAADFIRYFRWERFTFIYDIGNGADQLQKILRSVLSEDFVPQVEGFFRASDSDQAFRYVTELLGPDSTRRIILATSEQFADQLVIKLARGRDYSLLLLTPIGIVKRVSSQGFYTLTKFSVVDSSDSILQMLENRWKTLPPYYSSRRISGKELPDSVILNYDSSNILNTMVNKIAQDMPSLRMRTDVDCLEFSGKASETASYLKKVYVEHGATGRIKFDEEGRRKDYKINIIQATPFEIHKIGTWTEKLGLEVLPEFSKDTSTPVHAAYKNEPPVRVTSILARPFLERKEGGGFKGYIIDFLDALFNELKMNYELSLVKDGIYGRKTNGQWNGMIGELIRGEAQLAVAPLTKTKEREEVVDFSKSFMTTGLNILMKKPKTDGDRAANFTPFSFLTIWSVETWIVILFAAAFYSVAGYGISRFIGAPDRVRALETKGTDNLSPCGSIWFTFGSLFCRDTGIYPRNFTHRLWSFLWWIFCIFISLMYVSMLTSAFVTSRTTITTTHSRKTSQEVLKSFLDDGYPTIGILLGGSSSNFFLKSEIGIYHQYGRYLQENSHIRSKTYTEGVERVRKSEGDFAFIMESTSSQLVTDMEPCDTLVTSGYLVTRQYAVATQKNSTLREMVDHAVLSLMETGTLRKLYEKWWHNLTTSCENPQLNILPKIYNTSLSLHEASGIFFIFILLALVSTASAVIEYYIRQRNMTIE